MTVIDFWAILILAIAISVDSFGVGTAYGLRGIKIGLGPLLIISSISTLAIYLTSSFGIMIANYLGRDLAQIAGNIILMLIGCWLVYSAYRNLHGSSERKILFSFRIKSLGIIINILREPVKADFDRSGTINVVEAIFLGFALALDAIGAGLGAGLSGFTNIYLPLLIGIVNLIFLCSGFYIGEKAGNIIPERFEIVPGLIIICLGLFKLF